MANIFITLFYHKKKALIPSHAVWTSALLGATHQAFRFTFTQIDYVVPALLSSTEDKLCSRLSSWTCTQLFHILYHKDPGPIQHRFLIYISFPFTVYIVVESFLVFLHISCQIVPARPLIS